MEKVKEQISRFILSVINRTGAWNRPFSLKMWTTAHQPPCFRVPSLFFIPLALILLQPLSASSQETIIPVVYLNEEQKGEFFVRTTEDGDFWVQVEDLEAIGLEVLKGKTLEIEGNRYLSLKSVGGGLTFQFDPTRQTLKIQAPPEMLAKQVLDLSAKPPKNLQRPQENSAFFNYGFTYSAEKGFQFDSIGFTGQLGVRIGSFLFLSDAVVHVGEKETRFQRLMTSVTFDRRQRLETIVFGDDYATSGNLGSCLFLGGISYSKNYGADPGVIKRPLQGYQGYVSTPSEISVYLNGSKIASEKVSPGGFDIRNILAYGGRQDLEIVVKDAFGREQRITNPFYVSDSLLAKGFHDFAYFLGFRRENLGATGDKYGDPAFLGYHRYGLTNSLTVGLRGEAGSGLYNLGGTFVFAGPYGALDLAFSGSRNNKDQSGSAYAINYTFQGYSFNAHVGTTQYSESYSTISLETLSGSAGLKRPKAEYNAGVGFGAKRFGSLALNYSKSLKYGSGEKEQWGLMYSKGFGQRFNLTLSYFQTNEKEEGSQKDDYELFACLTYYPWKETIMTNTGVSGDTFRGTLSLQKNAPTGEGYGYRAAVDIRDQDGKYVTTLRPYFQYNGPYGIYSGQIAAQFGGAENQQTYQFNASGAIVYVGRTFGFSRPVDDSFALVKVGEVPGVRVYHNNQEIGRTDRYGKMVIPNFISYDANQIRINDKDIPLNFALKDVSRLISPGYRSGTLIRFQAKKVQAFTGLLKVIKGGKKIPVEYQAVNIKINGKTLTFQTGRDGEFFIEDAQEGSYKAFFKFSGKAYSFDIHIPRSDDIIIDGGEIHVQGD